LIHKAKTEELKTMLQQLQTGLTGGSDRSDRSHRSDRCVTTQSGYFEAEDMRQYLMAYIEATQGVVSRHPSNGENLKTSETAPEGLVSLVVK
jgi:hypothetical protein